MVGPEYFEVMGTRILGGRGISEADRPDGAPVAVISESMARRFWPGESPLGRRIRMGAAKPVEREIVGIAEDIRIGGLYEPPENYVYVPYSQNAQSFGLLLVETHDRPASTVSVIRRRIAEIDPALPILSVSSVAEHMDRVLYEDRRNAWVALAIAVLALTLGAVGVHGVVSLVTVRRTREIGIRLVLGARRGQLLRLLLDKGLRLALVGVALGILGGIAAGKTAPEPVARSRSGRPLEHRARRHRLPDCRRCRQLPAGLARVAPRSRDRAARRMTTVAVRIPSRRRRNG